MNDYITVQELTRRTGIPERTLRRYINRHKQFFMTRKEGGVNYIATEAGPLLMKIRAAYDEGMTAAQVDEAMTKQGAPVTIEETSTGRAVTMTAAEAMLDLRRSIVMPMLSISEQQEEMMEALKELTDELHQERERSQALSEGLEVARGELEAIRREVAALREPGGRGRDKGQAEIMRELRATREALEASEARQRKQEKRLDEVAEWTRPKAQEPEKRRRWWPFGR